MQKKYLVLIALLASFSFFLEDISYAAKTIEELQRIQISEQNFYDTQEPTLTEQELQFFNRIHAKLRQSRHGKKLLKTAEHLKYRYGFSTSTYTVYRTIYLKKHLDLDNAVLDFSYELSNLINYKEYFDLNIQAINNYISKKQFTNRNLDLEAQAVYWQYLVAKDLNLLHLDSKQPFTFVLDLDQDLSVRDLILLLKYKLKNLAGTSGINMSLEDYYKNQYLELRNGFTPT